MEDEEQSDWENAGRTLMIRAYHINFDGERYGPDEITMRIEEYSGEKELRSLHVYPLRYDKDKEKVENDLHDRGKRFLPVIRERHCYYDGPSLLFSEYGMEPMQLGPSLNAEYVDGEVMIDFKEGSRANPWSMEPLEISHDASAFRWWDRADPMEIKFWDGPTRLKLLRESIDISQTQKAFTKQFELSILKHDNFIKTHKEKETWLKEYTIDLSTHFDDEEYTLLPQRLIAHSFRARKFFMADIDCILPMTFTKHSFRDLRINIDHKRMVKSLVRSHFNKQDMRRQESRRT